MPLLGLATVIGAKRSASVEMNSWGVSSKSSSIFCVEKRWFVENQAEDLRSWQLDISTVNCPMVTMRCTEQNAA